MSADTASKYFTDDHRHCDDTWAELEAAVTRKDTAAAQKHWQAFQAELQRHFRMEEEVLFPAIEDASGMQGGPTVVMRMEHTQMRGLLEQMAQSAAGGQWESVLDHGDSLLMLIQQHNAKEEGVLYPMADRFLSPQWPELQERLRQL